MRMNNFLKIVIVITILSLHQIYDALVTIDGIIYNEFNFVLFFI